MKRIDTATKAVDLFGLGKHGFRDGDPLTGIQATQLIAGWFNGVQEELAAIIEAAGLSLDGGDLHQTLAAVRLMLQAQTPFKGIKVYPTAGIYNWAPGDLTRCLVIVRGGGAAGNCARPADFGGGGGGGQSIKLCDLTGVPTVPVTVGAGGIATLGAPGTSGGSSSFGSLCSATGGSFTSGGYGSGGKSGMGSGGDINSGLGDGGSIISDSATSLVGGRGGGASGTQANGVVPVGVGSEPGAGGTGGNKSMPTDTLYPAANGKDGCVIILY